MAPIVYCRECHTGFAAVGVIPQICPECKKEAHWTTDLNPWPFQLSENDKRFLKTQRIKVDEDR